jgi:hypothetical protein
MILYQKINDISNVCKLLYSYGYLHLISLVIRRLDHSKVHNFCISLLQVHEANIKLVQADERIKV